MKRTERLLTLNCLLGLLPLSAIAAEIKVDGEVGDWSGIETVNDPSEGAEPCDWRKFALATDGSHLYLRYTTEGEIDFTKGTAYMVFLDTDNVAQTGFRGSSSEFSIGADYLLQGTTLFRYSGGGSDWSWEQVGPAEAATRANEAEFAIDLADLGAPKKVAAFLYGDNEAEGVGGKTLDLLPDDAYSTGGAVTLEITKD